MLGQSVPMRHGCPVRLRGENCLLYRARTRCRAGRDLSLVPLPLFPLGSVLHPGQMGDIRVFEPQYVALFQDLDRSTPRGQPSKFGHILSPAVAPPLLLEDSVGGLPRLGVAAVVRSFIKKLDGSLVIGFEGTRRFVIRGMWSEEPYKVAAVEWYDDAISSLDGGARLALDHLEQQVYEALEEVARCTVLLGRTPGGTAGLRETTGGLPDSVLRYRPPAAAAESSVLATAAFLSAAGYPAGSQIAMWQRSGSTYAGRFTPQSSPRFSSDPYRNVRAHIGRDQRQEIFSFAAASVLELGLAERLALLQSQDTAGRLEWVMAAIRPHLKMLQARLAVKDVMDRD